VIIIHSQETRLRQGQAVSSEKAHAVAQLLAVVGGIGLDLKGTKQQVAMRRQMSSRPS
jgi:hypothetical protein